MTEQTEREKWVAEARSEGIDAAKRAASWAVDGNTDPAHYARMVRWFDEGDPQLDDHLPAYPDLSGQWDSEDTPIRLYERITGNDHGEAEEGAGMAYETLVGALVDALATAWEEGVSETFQPECERLIRAALPEDSECGHCGHRWNSVLVPTPAARCPNEYEHEDD